MAIERQTFFLLITVTYHMQASEASSPLACGEPEAERIRSPKKKDVFLFAVGVLLP